MSNVTGNSISLSKLNNQISIFELRVLFNLTLVMVFLNFYAERFDEDIF